MPLIRYSGGRPDLLAAKMKVLRDRSVIEWDQDTGWHVARDGSIEEMLTPPFSGVLYEPIDKLREKLSAETFQRLELFLQLGALCGSIIPADYIFRHMNLAGDERGAFVDLIDDELVTGSDPPLLHDHQYSHPGFSDCLVYRFTNPLFPSIVLDRLNRDERRLLASQFLDDLDRNVKIASRSIARLFVELTRRLDRDDRRAAFEHRLAWWIGLDEADEFEETLVGALACKRLAPHVLWKVIAHDATYQPPYRKLALLNAYERQPDGIPVDTLPGFCHQKASVLYDCGKYAEAETLCRQALDLRGRRFGPDHPDTLPSTNLLGMILHAEGRLAEAEPLLRKVLDLTRRIRGEEHHDTLASMSNLGTLLMDQGNLTEAEPLLRDTLQARRRILTEEHPDTLRTMNNLGSLLMNQGNLTEAEPLLWDTLQACRRILGEEHPDTLGSMLNFGTLLRDQGKLEEALPLCQEGLETSRRRLGDAHPITVAFQRLLDHLKKRGGGPPDSD